MKKAILLLMLVPTLFAAQGLQLVSVTPIVLCPGDSIFFTVKIVNGNNTQLTLQGPSLTQAWQYGVADIKTWPYKIENGDTLYILRVKSAPELGIGILSIYTYGNGNNTNTITALCGPVGALEYRLDNVPVQYFDLQGNPTPLKSGSILIEQRGNTRRKILILN
jgi:hypothetical protein